MLLLFSINVVYFNMSFLNLCVSSYSMLMLFILNHILSLLNVFNIFLYTSKLVLFGIMLLLNVFREAKINIIKYGLWLLYCMFSILELNLILFNELYSCIKMVSFIFKSNNIFLDSMLLLCIILSYFIIYSFIYNDWCCVFLIEKNIKFVLLFIIDFICDIE